MIEGDNDEAAISKSFGRIVVSGEAAAIGVASACTRVRAR
jgi:hypothetical protein